MYKILRKKKLEKAAGEEKDTVSGRTLTKSLEKNIVLLKNAFSGDETVMYRVFQNKHLDSAKCCIFYLDGMVNSEIINENIIQPILSDDLTQDISNHNLLDELRYKIIVANNISVSDDFNTIAAALYAGDTVFLLENCDRVLVIDSKGWQTRSITEPESARVVRGPREGFTESIIMNISLIRRKIKSHELKFKFREIGERTHTKVCICYIDDIISKDVLKELERRLDEIKIDGVLDSGYIQELIRDEPFSPLETVGYSERPDVVAGRLLGGRVAVIVDGSPVVLTVPFVIIETIQSNEDYYNNYIFASINRLFRGMSLLLSISVPAVFLAIVTYHQEMLPTPLLLSISASREGVPFPTVLSMFIMLLIFDLLREVGTRMPTPIGQAVNIVGTLVLGQAAVEARLVSAPIVIVTAFTGIVNLMNITFIGPSILIRFFLLFASAFMGIYGFIFGFVVTLLHLMSLRSFGVPYMLGTTKIENHDGQDVLVRAPWWSMTLRPKIIGARNLVRQSSKNRRGNNR